jgi:p-cumate 2,3-dioxygenase beta subunit
MPGSELALKEVIRPPAANFTRDRCETFFIEETTLLDEWRLDEWFALFTEDALYEVPMAGLPESNSAETLFYIADDHRRLQHRVERLKKTSAHAEWPRSVGCRLIGNVRVLGETPTGTRVDCKFITYRTKNNVTDTYFGVHRYLLRDVDGEIRIAGKRTILAMNALRPQGRVSILL